MKKRKSFVVGCWNPNTHSKPHKHLTSVAKHSCAAMICACLAPTGPRQLPYTKTESNMRLKLGHNCFMQQGQWSQEQQQQKKQKKETYEAQTSLWATTSSSSSGGTQSVSRLSQEIKSLLGQVFWARPTGKMWKSSGDWDFYLQGSGQPTFR